MVQPPKVGFVLYRPGFQPGGTRPEAAVMTIPELRHRLRPPWPALDVHVHPLKCFGPHAVASPAEDARRLVETARRAGVEKMCLFSLHAPAPYEPTAEQRREATDWGLAVRAARPGTTGPSGREVS